MTWITLSSEEKPLLIYTHYPEFSSIRINNIQAGPEKRKGIGSALLSSQLDFWKALNVIDIAVSTHSFARGFYKRIGFVEVSHSPEHSEEAHKHTILMRTTLDKTSLKKR